MADSIALGIGLSGKPKDYADLYMGAIKQKAAQQAAVEKEKQAKTEEEQKAWQRFSDKLFVDKNQYLPAFADNAKEIASKYMQDALDKKKQFPNDSQYYMQQALEKAQNELVKNKTFNDQAASILKLDRNKMTAAQKEYADIVQNHAGKQDFKEKVEKWKQDNPLGDPTDSITIDPETGVPFVRYTLEGKYSNIADHNARRLNEYMKNSVPADIQQRLVGDKQLNTFTKTILPKTKEEAEKVSKALGHEVKSVEDLVEQDWADKFYRAEVMDRHYKELKGLPHDQAQIKAFELAVEDANKLNTPRITQRLTTPTRVAGGGSGASKEPPVIVDTKPTTMTVGFKNYQTDDTGKIVYETDKKTGDTKAKLKDVSTVDMEIPVKAIQYDKPIKFKGTVTKYYDANRLGDKNEFNPTAGQYIKKPIVTDINTQNILLIPFNETEQRFALPDEIKAGVDGKGKPIKEKEFVADGKLTGTFIAVDDITTKAQPTSAQPKQAASVQPAASKSTISTYAPNIQAGIKAFMKANNYDEATAIRVLKEAKKIK